MGQWMIYGAGGYTGTLIAEEAVRRGHAPVLAGRPSKRMEALQSRLGLEEAVFSLEKEADIADAVGHVDLVFHAAGPFVDTAGPMVRACLDRGVHYLDITGELEVFEQNYSFDAEARKKGVTLLSGAGFSSIATDCLARYQLDRMPDATVLELAVSGMERMSPGTVKTVLNQLPKGTLIRKDGRLMSIPAGSGGKKVRFLNGERTIIPTTFGDLITAYRSTGIPNILTYMAFPAAAAAMMPFTGPVAQIALGFGPLRKLLQKAAGIGVSGPGEKAREAGRSYLWSRVINDHGAEGFAWLETSEAYRFTAEAAVRAVERILEKNPAGALSPSEALGVDFVLEIPGTRRYDKLEP
ncbi:MAG TPA: saccharopine dehydrogenase NADP-binding domain-containing protein [Nitrospiria bacterium]